MGLEAILMGIGLAMSGASTGYQMKAGMDAADEQAAAQKKSEAMADEATNRANKKQPNANAIMAALQKNLRSGMSSTMLTGPAGVDPGAMSLGRTSLLGG